MFGCQSPGLSNSLFPEPHAPAFPYRTALCTSVRGQSTGEQRPHQKAPVSGAQAAQPHPVTLPLLLPQPLPGRRAGRGNWLEERQRKVSVAPCTGRVGGGRWGRGAARRWQSGSSCVTVWSQCKPRGHSFSLCVLPSAQRAVMRTAAWLSLGS